MSCRECHNPLCRQPAAADDDRRVSDALLQAMIAVEGREQFAARLRQDYPELRGPWAASANRMQARGLSTSEQIATLSCLYHELLRRIETTEE